MSLGWQCESAILPSKAKPIKIDSTSILGLKALVYSEEQKRSNNSTASNRHLGAHKSKTLNVVFTDKFEGNKTRNSNPVHSAHNNSVEEDKEARVLSALTAKSKLYDEIKNGSLNGSSVLFGCELNPGTDSSDYGLQQHTDDNSDVLDEYGRSKPSQYQWSTGQQSSNDTYKKDKAVERNFLLVVEERLREQPHPQAISTNSVKDNLDFINQDTSHSSKNVPLLSSAARVKTQWEKTLNNSARGYLDQVHRDVQTVRGLQTTDTADPNSSNGVGKKRNAREERLEMLRAKQQRVTQGSSTDQ
jgi:hypothetical protein